MTLSTAAPTLREAAVADAVAIETVRLATWRVAYADLLPTAYLAGMSVDTYAPRMARRLAEPVPGQAILVAEHASEIIGFASTGPNREEPRLPAATGELYAIYVAPDRQGTGAGRALHSAALTRLRAAGFTTATLRVLAGNGPARAFYERYGWRPDAVVEPFEPAPGISVPELRYRLTL